MRGAVGMDFLLAWAFGLGLGVGANDGEDFVGGKGGGLEEVEEGAAEVAGGTGEEDVTGHGGLV